VSGHGGLEAEVLILQGAIQDYVRRMGDARQLLEVTHSQDGVQWTSERKRMLWLSRYRDWQVGLPIVRTPEEEARREDLVSASLQESALPKGSRRGLPEGSAAWE
jgi:hypothetical protein